MYQISFDTGGTFTDVVVADNGGIRALEKAPTTPGALFEGVHAALVTAAASLKHDVAELLARTDAVIYGTTQATNAIIERTTAKTAFVTTKGFPDTLVIREGGKARPHDHTIEYPQPYVPRRFTYELDERVTAEGAVVRSLSEDDAKQLIEVLSVEQFAAVAVCFLWAVSNPQHELLMGSLVEELLPGVACSLSHQVLPIVREYRRASATAIDASLKPLISRHLSDISGSLSALGFRGNLLVSTSTGGCLPVAEVMARPIQLVKSGPAVAPIAAGFLAKKEQLDSDIISCDVGGTSFDVAIVRDGKPLSSRETWIGEAWTGHILGVPTVDVHSVGAGGGSLAWVDAGGLLRLGPRSAGAVPGPACYGRGGTEPTVTDAALVLGYIDPTYFLAGRIPLDTDAATRAVERLGARVRLPVIDAAHAILALATEQMVSAIGEITVNKGIDPRELAVMAGGGAAGVTIAQIARELECRQVIVPGSAGALSAVGMQVADVVYEREATCVTISDDFAFKSVSTALRSITDELDRFREAHGVGEIASIHYEYAVDARYAWQVWDLEVPLLTHDLGLSRELDRLIERFHAVHAVARGINDRESPVEFLNWKGRVVLCRPQAKTLALARGSQCPNETLTRVAYFGGKPIRTPRFLGSALAAGDRITGPAIVQEPTTTIVVYPRMTLTVTPQGNYRIGP